MTTLRDLLLARADDDRPGLRWRGGEWTWREYVERAAERATWARSVLGPERPPHVGVLLDNTPEMALQLAAAALGGHVVVGLNTTRRGPALAADITKADCQVVVTDAAHRDLLPDLDVPIVDLTPVVELVETSALAGFETGLGGPPQPTSATTVVEQRARNERASVETTTLGLDKLDHHSTVAVAADDLFMLIFTSGTSGEPKAVRVTHEKVAGPGWFLADRFGLTQDDVCYVSMPLFHSNAVMAGWGVALACGATIALGERFSASGFVDEVRALGATYLNYVGKPLAYVLATPPRPDDADNPLRIAFGNEANERDIAAFGERFSCTVIDGFGSTENAVIVSRIPGTPPGALGMPLDDVMVLDPTGVECPPAEFDTDGRVTNLDAATGELVNVTGTGQFAGYYNDDAATAERMRDGMYWSGDLAYRDAAGFAYYAGRTADWLRVDGENLAAAPIERILLRHPSISEAAVYAVPDPLAGDRLVAALVTTTDLDPSTFETFLDEQPDLSPKARPFYVRLLDSLPRTATNKVLKRALRAQPLDDDTQAWVRDERGTSYTPR